MAAHNTTLDNAMHESAMPFALQQTCLSPVKKRRKLSLPLIYAVSGMCSLIYQLVWVKQLSLIFGSGFTAVSVVTAVFFLGLGLGGWIGGRLAAGLKRPLRAYALAEAGITLCALLVPFVMKAADVAYGAWYPAADGNLYQTAGLRLVLSSCILLPPVILMGATVPLVIQAYSRRAGRLGRDTGLIYGMNAMGAAAGVLVTGCLLFRSMGISHSNLLAVGLNAVVAACALMLSREECTAPGHTLPVASAVPEKNGLLLTIFAVSGFLYIGYELLWMRYFQLFFRDSIYLYASCIAAVILGTAAGGALIGRAADRFSPPCFLASLFALSSLLHGGAMMLLAQLHRPIVLLASQYPYLEAIFIFLALLPPFLCMGGSFPVITRALGKTPEAVGNAASRAYAVNTLGSLAGSLCTPFLLLPILGLDGTLLLFLAGGIICALALRLVSLSRSSAMKSAGFAALALVCSFPLALMFSHRGTGLTSSILERMKGGGEITEIRQGVLGTNWAVKMPNDQTVLYENLVAFSRGGSPSFIVQGFIPLLLMEKTPESLLGLCFGGGLTYRAAQLFPEIQRIDLVDISSGNVDMAMRLMEGNTGLQTDPRVHFHIDDAYSYVKYSQRQHDLIQIDSNPPFYSHNCSTLYSREFYELCRSRLTPDGMFTQVLPIKQLTNSEMKSILHTFASVFPHVMLWWNDLDPLMIGSNTPFLLNPARIAARLDRPEVAEALRRSSGEAKYDSLGHFLSGLLLLDEGFRAAGMGGGMNTVDRNYLEYSSTPELAPDNLPLLRQHLCSWEDASALLKGNDLFRAYEPQLEARRNFLMGLSQRRMMLSRIRL